MKISVITVSYNSASTILDALNSTRMQSHEDYEHLVIDGRSKDDTAAIVEENLHPKLIFVSEPDNGIYDAMNKGLKIASGEVIGILNSDDFYPTNNVLSEVVSLFDDDPSLDVVMGSVDFVGQDNLNSVVRCVESIRFSPWMFRFGFMPPHPAVFIRRTAYERIGGYKSDYKITCKP